MEFNKCNTKKDKLESNKCSKWAFKKDKWAFKKDKWAFKKDKWAFHICNKIDNPSMVILIKELICKLTSHKNKVSC